jgi:hypothetical protein
MATMKLDVLIKKLQKMKKKLGGDVEVFADCSGSMNDIYNEIGARMDEDDDELYVYIAVG